MKDWKKRWKTELNNVVPSLDNKIKEMPINVKSEKADSEPAKKGFFNNLTSNKRKFVAGLSTCLAVLICVLFVVPMIITNTAVPKLSSSAVMVEINPSAVFSTDEKGVVTKVMSANADADVILSDESIYKKITAVPLDEAMVTFIDYSAKLGYIDFDKQSAIRISACSGSEKSLVENVKKEAENYFKGKGAYIAVVTDELSAEDFCSRMGSEVKGTIDDVVDSIENEATIFTERVNEWKDYYDDIFSENDIIKGVTYELNEIQEKYTAKLTKLEKVAEKNELIKNHPENHLYRDYWTIKNSLFKPEDAELIALMEDMTNLVSEIYLQYGEKLTSALDLKLTIDSTNNAISLYDGVMDLGEMTLDIIKNSTILKELFALGGSVAESVLGWIDIPESYEDFTARIDEYFNIRWDQNKDNYLEEKEAISDDNYNSFIDSILATNNSLSDYFESLK